MTHPKYDVIVVGSGVAGCAAALSVAGSGGRVALITKSPDLSETNTRYAQGGIIYTAPDDSPRLLANDILDAGARAGEPGAARLLAEEGPEIVERLLIEELGVPFDRDTDGKLLLTREGAHSVARIIHRKDTTGDAIQNSLSEAVAAHPEIESLPDTRLTSLLMAGERCVGVSVERGDGEILHIRARAVVLATGGYAGLYERTTNPRTATGDGLALALAAGAETRDLHYVQFHPTVLYEPEKTGRAALISEAVRGEGGVIVNADGEEFIEHALGSLAPRDVVTRSIHDEMAASGHPCVYLDARPERTGRPAGWFAGRFPEIHAHCIASGTDPDAEVIPISPAAHYTCGGVATDLYARTSVPGLLAAGEVASTGLHGANRLASTSLLEGLLFGWRAGETAMKLDFALEEPAEAIGAEGRYGRDTAGDEALDGIGRILWSRCGIVRDASGLETGLLELSRLGESVAGTNAKSALRVARAVIQSALEDSTSLGCHRRSDTSRGETRLAGLPR